ncbi:hypothetical protein JL722_4077 [Aureococcus anophagefferens]|nr:hypothetical protein JL722_4077 [Aureococcus anophagefferens]
MRAARLALCCVAAASAKIGRIAAHGFVKGGQYRSAPLGRGTEAERAALEAARAAKAELDAENRLRRDSHRSWERRDNGTDRANATGGRAGAAADAIILEFPKSGRTWLFGLLTEAARLKGGRNFTVLRSHTMGVIDHPSYFERVYRAKGSKAIPRHVQLKAFVEWTTGSIATHVAFLNAWVPAALAAPDRAVVVTYEGLSARAAARRPRAGPAPPPGPRDPPRTAGPLHVLDLIANCFLNWRLRCRHMKAAIAANDFARLKERGLNSTTRASPRRPPARALAPVATDARGPRQGPPDGRQAAESSKFRAGKSHGAHEAITARPPRRAGPSRPSTRSSATSSGRALLRLQRHGPGEAPVVPRVRHVHPGLSAIKRPRGVHLGSTAGGSAEPESADPRERRRTKGGVAALGLTSVAACTCPGPRDE